ncbi:uncharacterized protein LOC141829894 [Curcuma longa]|uniref:uncharacterized protein LOC141829894 n=1 Tax=Curcuma longa TaxID=136217 RepID=UPI003D9E75E7
MTIGAWNIRGLNKGLKQKEVVDLILRERLSAFCILETKLTTEYYHSLKTSRFQMWSSEHRVGDSGISRMLLLWDSRVIMLEIQDWTEQYIHTLIKHQVTGTSYAVTFVYGQLTITSQRRMWDGLRHIAGSMGLPWLLVGDFNSPLSAADKKGGLDVTTYTTTDFHDFVSTTGVDDLRSVGCQCTWTNGRIVCKLDRAMVNALWLEQDRSSYAQFHPPEVFLDHALCTVSIMDVGRRKRKPFKIFNMWTTHPSFLQTVQDFWEHTEIGSEIGTALYRLREKLRQLKHPLKKLNHQDFQHIQERVDRSDFQSDCIQFGRVLTSDQQAGLIRPPSEEEIKRTLFDIGDLKAPGPDGYSYKFFKHTWDIIGEDFITAIFFYKVISKIIASRLADVSDHLLHPAQTAFVKGRAITDNIHLA